MAINMPTLAPQAQEESTLDKIAQGLNIINSTLGIALAVPKYMQDKKSAALQNRATEAGIKKTEADTQLSNTLNSPITPATSQRLTQAGINANVLPATEGEGRDLLSKVIETPSQRNERENREAMLGVTLGNSERASRNEQRQIVSDERVMQDKADEKKKKEQEEFDERYVPGIGLAWTTADQKELKDAVELKSNFTNKINEMIELRKQYGFNVTDRAAVARGKQLSKDLLLIYKNMAKLGVLSKSDENIINTIIPSDPLGYSFKGSSQEDPILHVLEKFKGDTDLDFGTTVKNRVKVPDEEIQRQHADEEDNAAMQWATSNPNDPRAKEILNHLNSKR